MTRAPQSENDAIGDSRRKGRYRCVRADLQGRSLSCDTTQAFSKLVAGFLAWLTGPAIEGTIFGFFLGMAVCPFEDPSIFLHASETYKALIEPRFAIVRPIAVSAI